MAPYTPIADYSITLAQSFPRVIYDRQPSEGAIPEADIMANHSDGHIIPVGPYEHGGVDGAAFIGTYDNPECPVLILRSRFKHQPSLLTLHMVSIPMTWVIMGHM
jgi:hypothetical protein